ncbi:MAG: L-ribulose-5-phosphate 3-epimerase [Oscillospiraceae bacterium]|nr:L-ribulose-5-phosphate 3-epimerase [Oscillospiraceae bacterium]
MESDIRYRLNLYEKAMPDEMDLVEKFLQARRCGFDSVEICIDAYEARQQRLFWSERQVMELAAQLSQHDIRVYTVSLSLLRSCPLGVLCESENAKALYILRRGVEFTSAVGARVMLINGYDVYDQPSTPQTIRRFELNLKKTSLIAAANGVIIGVENAEMPFIDSVEKAAHWAARAGSPYICVYADTGNTYNAVGGDTPLAIRDFECGMGRIAAVHLKDSLPGEWRYVGYGKGHVDFGACVPKLLELGVRIFTAELFWQPGINWEKEAVHAGQFLRGLLDK